MTITFKNILHRWMFLPLSISLLTACNFTNENALLNERIAKDNKAYQLASEVGSVEALGNYVKNFPRGENLLIADAEAWRLAKREDSEIGYKAYLDHFPNGKYFNDVFMSFRSDLVSQIKYYEDKAAKANQFPRDNFIQRAKDIVPAGQNIPAPNIQQLPIFTPLAEDSSIRQGQALESIAANSQNSVLGPQTNQNYFNKLEHQRQLDHKRVFDSEVVRIKSENANAQNLFNIQILREEQRVAHETQLNQMEFDREKLLADSTAAQWMEKAADIRKELLAYTPKDNASIVSIYWSDGDSGRITLSNNTVIKFRLDDWDAPETGGVGAAIGPAQCELERDRGFKSKEYMVENTREGVSYVSRGESDSYDRLLVDILVDGIDIGPVAASRGHLRSWRHDGKKALEPRPDWCKN